MCSRLLFYSTLLEALATRKLEKRKSRLEISVESWFSMEGRVWDEKELGLAEVELGKLNIYFLNF